MTPSWSSNCRADMPLECVAMRCAAQNHAVSGSLERCIAVPAVIEVWRPQSRHSYKRGRLFRLRRAALAAARADEPVRPAPFEQEGRAARFVRKCLLKFGKRARPGHRVYVLATSRGRTHETLYLDLPKSTG